MAENETDRHDREAGRQLAILGILGAIAIGAVGALLSSLGTIIVAAIAGSISALAFFAPVYAIRLVSGRLSETWKRRGDPTTPLETLHEIQRAREQGAPTALAVAELGIKSKRWRRWIGIAGMLLGTAGCVLSAALKWPGIAIQGTAALAFIGLVLWYRTL